MNEENSKCFECNCDIPAFRGMQETRISRWTGKTFRVDLCDPCWFKDEPEDEEDCNAKVTLQKMQVDRNPKA